MSIEVENHVLDLLPAFVLGALTEDENCQVADHLDGCTTCQAELAQLQRVADDLPLALLQTSPPARVKDHLLASIHTLHASPSPSSPSVFRYSLLRSAKSWLPLLGMALIIMLAVVNVMLWNQLILNKRQVVNPMQVVALSNTRYSPGAIGSLVMDPARQYGTLVVDNLADLNSISQYQVWLMRDGDRISGGVFSVNPDGYASLEIITPTPLRDYDTIGISIEPYGGSPAPTGAKVLGGMIPP